MSVVSAAAMANDRDDPMRLAFIAATGGSLQDICGDMPGTPFHCPVCHSLDGPPGAERPERQVTLWLDQTGLSGADLVDGALSVADAFLARGPPFFG